MRIGAALRPETIRVAMIGLMLSGLSGTGEIAGQSLDAGSDQPTVEDLAWLEGAWVGEGFGGEVEEVWLPPRGGFMLGTFRFLREGRTVFSEILMLGEFESGIEMRLKHLNPDMTGWEERDDYVSFPLEAAEPGLARFRGLVLRAVGRDSLEIEIRLRQQSGEVSTEQLRFVRLPLGPARLP